MFMVRTPGHRYGYGVSERPTDLAVGIGSHIETISSNIGVFVEVGVPTIRFAQKHTATNLLNLSTVATFFSAVTGTLNPSI
jgi:hypothetical protein